VHEGGRRRIAQALPFDAADLAGQPDRPTEGLPGLVANTGPMLVGTSRARA
jgi:hypothetical protein